MMVFDVSYDHKWTEIVSFGCRKLHWKHFGQCSIDLKLISSYTSTCSKVLITRKSEEDQSWPTINDSEWSLGGILLACEHNVSILHVTMTLREWLWWLARINCRHRHNLMIPRLFSPKHEITCRGIRVWIVAKYNAKESCTEKACMQPWGANNKV